MGGPYREPGERDEEDTLRSRIVRTPRLGGRFAVVYVLAFFAVSLAALVASYALLGR